MFFLIHIFMSVLLSQTLRGVKHFIRYLPYIYLFFFLFFSFFLGAGFHVTQASLELTKIMTVSFYLLPLPPRCLGHGHVQLCSVISVLGLSHKGMLDQLLPADGHPREFILSFVKKHDLEYST